MPYREGKRWRGSVMNGGKRYQRVCQTKKAALAWEEAKRRELESGQKEMIGITLFELCNKYLDYAERFHKRTYSYKRLVCRQIISAWGADTPTEEITPGMVLSYLDEQAKKRTPCASNLDLKELCVLWCWGREFCGLTTNPLARIKTRPYDRQVQHTPTQNDILKLLAAATRQEQVFLESFLQTGARKSEIFRWVWTEDINFDRREIRLGTRKTRDGSLQYDWLPISDSLHDLLFWWWKNRPVKESPYVFCRTAERDRGQPFTTRRKLLINLCNKAGVRQFQYHALRRFVASYLADTHKISAKRIQEVLRHRYVSTTEVYVRKITTGLRETMNLLSREEDNEMVRNERKE